MNYTILFLITVALLFTVYIPGIITWNFSRPNTVIQITFIPFFQWQSNGECLKGSNWFGAARVLKGRALKYNEEGTDISEALDSIGYFLRICGFEFEYIKILESNKDE